MTAVGARITTFVRNVQVRALRLLHAAGRPQIRLRPGRARVATVVEFACWTAGFALIALYAVARTDAAVNRAADLARVEQKGAPAGRHAIQPAVAVRTATHDPLVGAIEIPSLDLRVPLYIDTSELNLNRGAGLIEAMALPGEDGNLGVAGHRDGVFRALKDIEVGAAIEVLAQDRVYSYRVTSITIVDKTDAALLRDAGEPVITLVTCYPFYFVGNAPRRFVVRGALESTRAQIALVSAPARGVNRLRQHRSHTGEQP